MNSKHIVYLFPHGFASRMVLRTGVAKELAEKGFRISVISPNGDESYFQQECQENDVQCYKDNEDTSFLAEWFRVHRSYFLDDVVNNVTLMTNHQARYEQHPFMRSALEKINTSLAPQRWFRRVMKGIETLVNRTKDVRKRLEMLKPDLLVLMNPFGQKETLYLIHAKELGIPVACQMLSWDNITSKGTPLMMPNYFLSWGPIMTSELKEIYDFPSSKIFECGVAHFDVYHQRSTLASPEKIRKKFSLPIDRPYLFYGMVSEMMCGKEVEILEWLVKEINKNAFVKPCSLIIRPHPQTISGPYASSRETIKRLKNLAGDLVAIDMPPVLSEKLAWDLPKDDMAHLASLLAGSAMCINASSTLCLDACMANVPVIAVGFDGDETVPYYKSSKRSLDCTHMMKLFSFGGIPIAKTFSNLKEHINAFLLHPEIGVEGRNRAVEQECGMRDGKSSERVVKSLIKIMEELNR